MADDNPPQYPYMFPASEWSNKYSTMNSKSFPMYNYYGAPTDAMGNPITNYVVNTPSPVPGTTMNTTSGLSDYDKLRLNSAINNARNASLSGNSGIDGGGRGAYQGTRDYQTEINQLLAKQYSGSPSTQSVGGGSGGGGNPASGSNFGYLLALANPGKTQTLGVYDYPKTTTAQPDSASMDMIIRAMQSGAMTPPPAPVGIGGGSSGITYGPNTSFLNTLAALRAGSPGAK